MELKKSRLSTQTVVFAFFALVTSVVCSAESEKPLLVHIGGRVITNKVNNLTQFEYAWPGVYFESRFSGTRVDVHLNDSVNMLNLILDDQTPIVLSKPGKTVYTLNNLPNTIHKIRLEKRTETFSATAIFEGFFIPAAQNALAAEIPVHGLEIIGDSFSVGYGDMSSSRQCNSDQVFASTNTQQAYGALVAKYFHADYQINAISGRGVVRNYKGSNPDSSLLIEYPHVFNFGGVKNNGKWAPNIIAIVLGVNDFNTPLEPHERWKSREDLQNNFVAAYEKFVLGLRVSHPKATIFLIAPDKPGSELATQITRVFDNLKKQSVQNIILKLPDVELALSGCDYHASAEDHQKVANMFIDYIEKNPELWGEK
jgi:hypothetical protein